MSHKKFFLGLLIFNLYICIITCFSLDDFSKSIYASINETQNIKSISKKSVIETEYLILKYENPLNNHEISYNNKISLYLNSKFYHNIISLDTKNKMDFYTLKNNFLSATTSLHSKIIDPYTIIEDENHFILERLEYIDENLNLEDKKNNLAQNYWYNLINEKPLNTSNAPLLEELLNIKLNEVHNAIKDSYNKIGKWNRDNSYELVFVCDKKKNKFLLHKIFVYYIKGETKSCQINLKQMNFENVILEQGNNIYKNFNYKKFLTNEKYLNNAEYKIKISTNKKDSIYHNMMTLNFDNQLINKYMKQSNNDEISFIIHYILTEDVYIERNEFIKRFEEMLYSNGINKTSIKENIKYDLYASKFIEQELSSDLSEQAYFTFYIKTNKYILDLLNNTISFTVHFRYQPSLNSTSNKTHQKTFMPQPFIYILNNNATYEKDFLDDIIYNNNIFKGENKTKDNLEIFEDEIIIKKRNVLNQVNILNENYLDLIHQIPAGQKKYFLIVTLVTVITSVAGFCIILFGVVNYVSANERYDKMKKIE
jgi:hypothetical protein